MPNDTMTNFTRLEGALMQMGMPTVLVPATADNPLEHLLVALDDGIAPGQDSRYLMQLFYSSDVAAAARAQAGEPPDPDASIVLQFILSLDVQVPGSQALEVYRLLSVFNRLLPAGALDLTDEDVVYLRYSLVAESKASITLPQVADVLEMLGFFVQRMAPAIAAVCAGSQSRDQAIESTERLLIEAARGKA